MKQIILHQDVIVGPWVCARTGGEWQANRGATIGLAEDGKLIAGVVFEDHNGPNVMMHVAAKPGARWMTRDYLWICFDYPFNQLGCRRITGLVPSSKPSVLDFDKHLGFEYEATLEGAHPDGDLIVLKMTREKCRWLKLNRSLSHGRQE